MKPAAAIASLVLALVVSCGDRTMVDGTSGQHGTGTLPEEESTGLDPSDSGSDAAGTTSTSSGSGGETSGPPLPAECEPLDDHGGRVRFVAPTVPELNSGLSDEYIGTCDVLGASQHTIDLRCPDMLEPEITHDVSVAVDPLPELNFLPALDRMAVRIAHNYYVGQNVAESIHITLRTENDRLLFSFDDAPIFDWLDFAWLEPFTVELDTSVCPLNLEDPCYGLRNGLLRVTSPDEAASLREGDAVLFGDGAVVRVARARRYMGTAAPDCGHDGGNPDHEIRFTIAARPG